MEPFWDFGDFRGLSAFVAQMRGLTGPETEGALLGVGVLAGQPPQPLLLANAGIIRRDPSWGLGLGRPPWRRPPLVPVSEVPGTIRESLRAYNVPDDTTVMFVEPPQPLGLAGRGPGAGVAIEARLRGTLGPQLDTRWGPAHLTAGHVTYADGSPVHCLRQGWLHVRRSRFGSVAMQSVPEPWGPAGYDVAVVLPDEASTTTPCTVARLSQVQLAPLNGTLTGGVSGRGFGAIQGALDTHTDARGEHKWANSWFMWPGSIGTEGDSGAAVTTDANEVIGILVGGSRVTGTSTFGVLYVQDLESILRDIPIG